MIIYSYFKSNGNICIRFVNFRNEKITTKESPNDFLYIIENMYDVNLLTVV